MLLALVFLVAGVSKLADRAGSRQAIVDFGLPSPLATPLGILLPLAELTVAAALIPTPTAWWGAAAALALLLAAAAGIAAGPIGSGGFPGISLDDDDTALKAGPLGLNRQALTGEVPVAIQIPDAEVDAEVELNEIVDGVMQDPTGPWVVTWYQDLAALGEESNVVMAGHVDYWDVGPAIFYDITNGDVSEGDQITGVGEDGSTFLYEVKLRETVEVSALTSEKIGEIVGPTKRESITLITCGGEFDYSTGEYLSRTWLRAERVTA